MPERDREDNSSPELHSACSTPLFQPFEDRSENASSLEHSAPFLDSDKGPPLSAKLPPVQPSLHNAGVRGTSLQALPSSEDPPLSAVCFFRHRASAAPVKASELDQPPPLAQ